MLKTTTLSVRYVQDKSCLDSSKQSCMMTWFSPLMSVSLLATHGNACCGIDSQFIIAKKTHCNQPVLVLKLRHMHILLQTFCEQLQ